MLQLLGNILSRLLYDDILTTYIQILSHFSSMQIRRTDKTDEGLDTFHELDEYFIEAEAYFKKIELSQSSGRESLPRIVYLSSDNTTVLEDAKTR